MVSLVEYISGTEGGEKHSRIAKMGTKDHNNNSDNEGLLVSPMQIVVRGL